MRLLRRCLAKSPRQRLHHIADARIELEDPQITRMPRQDAAPRSAVTGFGRRLAWAALGGTLVAAQALLYLGLRPAEQVGPPRP